MQVCRCGYLFATTISSAQSVKGLGVTRPKPSRAILIDEEYVGYKAQNVAPFRYDAVSAYWQMEMRYAILGERARNLRIIVMGSSSVWTNDI